MTPTEAFKPLGAISISLTWLALGILVLKWRGHRGMSFSSHAAANKTAYLMMALAETIILPMFFIFIWKWFVPTFKLPFVVTLSVALSTLGLLIAAWVPDVEGRRAVFHRVVAYTAHILFIPGTFIMFLVPKLPAPIKIIWLMVSLYLAGCVLFFILSQKAKEYHLYLQALYLFLVNAAILITVYIR